MRSELRTPARRIVEIPRRWQWQRVETSTYMNLPDCCDRSPGGRLPSGAALEGFSGVGRDGHVAGRATEVNE